MFLTFEVLFPWRLESSTGGSESVGSDSGGLFEVGFSKPFLVITFWCIPSFNTSAWTMYLELQLSTWWYDSISEVYFAFGVWIRFQCRVVSSVKFFFDWIRCFNYYDGPTVVLNVLFVNIWSIGRIVFSRDVWWVFNSCYVPCLKHKSTLIVSVDVLCSMIIGVPRCYWRFWFLEDLR